MKLDIEQEWLPTSCACPLNCKGKLNIIYDPILYNVWTYCRICNFSGDLVELASAVWNSLDIETTVRKLGKLGLSIEDDKLHGVQVYIEENYNRRKRLKEFWTKWQSRLIYENSSHIRKLKKKLGIDLPITSLRWVIGPGLIAGAAAKQDAEYCFRPTVSARTTGLENAGEFRIFIGPDWIETIAIPMMDLPGRIKGYYFIGRECVSPEDVASKYIAIYNDKEIIPDTGKKKVLHDAGLAFYNAIHEVQDYLFVLNDPALLLQLHAWWFQNNTTIMPLTSMYHGKKYKTSTVTWDNIHCHKIFIGKPTPELFKHARATNGRVYILSEREKLSKKPLNELLETIKREASPWDEALEIVLTTLSVNKAEEILLNAELSGTEINYFISRCNDSLKTSLQYVLDNPQPRYVGINDIFIREQKGWTTQNGKQLISNTILRIRKQLISTNARFYSGDILVDGHSIPFTVPAEEIEKDTSGWLRRTVKQKKGYVVINEKWKDELLNIAIAFHEPKIEKAHDRIGWDIDDNCYVFPNYRITNTGKVETHPANLFQDLNTPALNMTQPTKLTKADIKELTTEGSELLWAIVASTLLPMLAAMYGYKKKGVLLIGTGARKTGVSLALQLGGVSKSHDETENPHDWPIALSSPENKTKWSKWLNYKKDKPYLIETDKLTALVLNINSDWFRLEANEEYLDNQEYSCLEKIIPNFMLYLIKNKLRLMGSNHIASILTWLSNWFQESGGDPNVVLTASKLLSMSDPCNDFMELLCLFYTTGYLDIVRSDFIAKQELTRAMILGEFNQERPTLFVSSVSLHEICEKQEIPTLISAKVTECLESSGLGKFHKQKLYNGWLISEEEWNLRLQAFTKANNSESEEHAI